MDTLVTNPFNQGTKVSLEEITEFRKQLSKTYIQDKTRAQAIFSEALKDTSSEDCCIFLTGSHGRKERSASSDFELIVVFKQGMGDSERTDLINKIESVVKTYDKEFDKKIEYKDLGITNTKVINYENKVIPTRAFDSKKIWGSSSLKKTYYSKIFSELNSSNSANYKKFTKEFKDKSVHLLEKEVLEQEENKENHFNTTLGKLGYDGKNIRASKFPFLRTIQYQLAHLIFNGVRTKKINETQLNQLRKLRTVPAKLEWMSENKFVNLSKEKIKLIADAYTISLIWYEASEKNFRLRDSKELQVDQEQLKELVTCIRDFAKK